MSKRVCASRRPRPKRRSLRLEPLEARIVLAVTAQLDADQTLLIEGDGQDDNVVLQLSDDALSLEIDDRTNGRGVDFTFLVADVAMIQVNVNAGNDRVLLNDVNGEVASAAPIEMLGGTGNDRLAARLSPEEMDEAGQLFDRLDAEGKAIAEQAETLIAKAEQSVVVEVEQLLERAEEQLVVGAEALLTFAEDSLLLDAESVSSQAEQYTASDIDPLVSRANNQFRAQIDELIAMAHSRVISRADATLNSGEIFRDAVGETLASQEHAPVIWESAAEPFGSYTENFIDGWVAEFTAATEAIERSLSSSFGARTDSLTQTAAKLAEMAAGYLADVVQDFAQQTELVVSAFASDLEQRALALADAQVALSLTAESHPRTVADGACGAVFRVMVRGGDGDDLLIGTDYNDLLIGGDGRDILVGRGCQDELHGDAGNDILLGGTEDDDLFGGEGTNLMSGGDGADEITGGSETDVAFGGEGADDIATNGGIDILLGQAGADTTDAGAGTLDISFGGGDSDIMTGGAGIDIMLGQDGADDMSGGAGPLNLLLGGAENDMLTGGDDLDLLIGNDGDDTAAAGGGTIDVLVGNEGDDDLRGEDGIDILLGNAGNDKLDAGAGALDVALGNEDDDLILGGLGTDLLLGSEGEDDIRGGPGLDLLIGGDDDDTMDGGDDIDVLLGGTGNDDMNSGAGALNLLLGDEGDDVIDGQDGIEIVLGGDGSDLIGLGGGTLNVALGGAGEDDIFGGAGIDVIIGGDDNDLLVGDTGTVDILVGGGGNDILDGGFGVDLLIGGDGLDLMAGGPGQVDVLVGGAGSDGMDGGLGIDLLIGGDGDDNIEGGPGSFDLLVGGTGDDDMKGESGINIMVGGTGDDDMEGDEDTDIIIGGEDDDSMSGAEALDIMLGSEGFDDMFGNDGIDLMLGGEDDDLIVGGADTDIILGGDGNDLLRGNDDSDLLLGGAGMDDIEGGDGDDLLLGGDGNDVMNGDDGDDIMDGGDGEDRMFGDDDSDMMAGGTGNDVMRGGKGDDIMYGNDDVDDIRGNEDNDCIHGNDANDDLQGNDGNDLITGGAGDDMMTGGSGDDKLDGEGGFDIQLAEDDFDKVWVDSDAERAIALAGGAEIVIFGTANIRGCECPPMDGPRPDANGPYVVDEGDDNALKLDASATTHPTENPADLVYEWDLDGDGVFGETGQDAEFGDEVGIMPMFDASQTDGPNSIDVVLRVTDSQGNVTFTSSQIQMRNVAPQVSIDSVPDGAINQPVNFVISTTDRSIADMNGNFMYVIDFGDGTVQEVTGSNVLQTSHIYTQAGSFVVQVTAKDKDGAISPVAVVGVNILGDQQGPTANANGPYQANEGDNVTLDASATTHPSQDPATLVYEWDLDGDGVFGETGAAAQSGDETGIAPVFDASNADGPSTRNVALRVTDNNNLSNTTNTSVQINNVAPQVQANGEPQAILNEPYFLFLFVQDVLADIAAGFLYRIDWGDGQVDEIDGPEVFDAEHRYNQPGLFNIQVTATDKDNGVSQPVIHQVDVPDVALFVTLDQPLGQFPARSVINLNRIDNELVVGIEPGCPDIHLHALSPEGILIDGQGPFPDPNQPGCGFGVVTTVPIVTANIRALPGESRSSVGSSSSNDSYLAVADQLQPTLAGAEILPVVPQQSSGPSVGEASLLLDFDWEDPQDWEDLLASLADELSQVQ